MSKWSLEGLECEGEFVSNYDGDTFKLLLPVCCKKYIFSCRLFGIDTPEIRSKDLEVKKKAKEVKHFVYDLMKNKKFNVKCYKFDKYGRVLCDISFPEDNTSLREVLLDKEYGYEYFGGKRS